MGGGKNLRKSNIELFRIVAMALVLVLHSNYFSIPQPCIIDLIEKPLESFGRIFIQSSSIGSVNMFILISGWFSIKTKLSSYTSIMFQYAYFAFGIYLLFLMIKLLLKFLQTKMIFMILSLLQKYEMVPLVVNQS